MSSGCACGLDGYPGSCPGSASCPYSGHGEARQEALDAAVNELMEAGAKYDPFTCLALAEALFEFGDSQWITLVRMVSDDAAMIPALSLHGWLRNEVVAYWSAMATIEAEKQLAKDAEDSRDEP